MQATASLWPFSNTVSLPPALSISRTTPSRPPTASRPPSGENARDATPCHLFPCGIACGGSISCAAGRKVPQQYVGSVLAIGPATATASVRRKSQCGYVGQAGELAPLLAGRHVPRQDVDLLRRFVGRPGQGHSVGGERQDRLPGPAAAANCQPAAIPRPTPSPGRLLRPKRTVRRRRRRRPSAAICRCIGVLSLVSRIGSGAAPVGRPRRRRRRTTRLPAAPAARRSSAQLTPAVLQLDPRRVRRDGGEEAGRGGGRPAHFHKRRGGLTIGRPSAPAGHVRRHHAGARDTFFPGRPRPAISELRIGAQLQPRRVGVVPPPQNRPRRSGSRGRRTGPAPPRRGGGRRR